MKDNNKDKDNFCINKIISILVFSNSQDLRQLICTQHHQLQNMEQGFEKEMQDKSHLQDNHFRKLKQEIEMLL